MHISLFPYHYAFISPSVLSQPLSRPQIEPNWSHLIKQMPEARINTDFRHFSPLFEFGKSKDIIKYICLSFVSFLPLFYFSCIYYLGSLIFCCQFVARFIITGRKTFDKYCLFYILASLYALSSSLSLNILYIHSGIA